MSRLLLPLVLALVASFFSACSSFDAHWKDAAHGKNGATCWDGIWKSGQKVYANGENHHGRLRCVLEPMAPSKNPKSSAGYVPEEVPRGIHAYFHANWLIFSGNYDMVLKPVPGKPHRYSGTHDLPAAFGGTYRYAATIAGDHLTACYTCRTDQGVFDLHRVPSGKK